MKKRVFRNYQEKMIRDLQDPELASAYLNQALIDDDPRVFLLALKNVFAARQVEMTQLSRDTELSRENLYRILSRRGNPKLTSIVSLLHTAGFSLAVQPYKK